MGSNGVLLVHAISQLKLKVDDELGRDARADLQQRNVDCTWLGTAEEPTGKGASDSAQLRPRPAHGPSAAPAPCGCRTPRKS